MAKNGAQELIAKVRAAAAIAYMRSLYTPEELAGIDAAASRLVFRDGALEEEQMVDDDEERKAASPLPLPQQEPEMVDEDEAEEKAASPATLQFDFAVHIDKINEYCCGQNMSTLQARQSEELESYFHQHELASIEVAGVWPQKTAIAPVPVLVRAVFHGRQRRVYALLQPRALPGEIEQCPIIVRAMRAVELMLTNGPNQSQLDNLQLALCEFIEDDRVKIKRINTKTSHGRKTLLRDRALQGLKQCCQRNGHLRFQRDENGPRNITPLKRFIGSVIDMLALADISRISVDHFVSAVNHIITCSCRED